MAGVSRLFLSHEALDGWLAGGRGKGKIRETGVNGVKVVKSLDEVTDRLPAAIVGEQTSDGEVALQPQDAPQQPSTDSAHGDGTTGAGTPPR